MRRRSVRRPSGSLSNPKKKVRVRFELSKRAAHLLERKVKELRKSANPRRTSLSEIITYCISKTDLDRLTLKDLAEWRKTTS